MITFECDLGAGSRWVGRVCCSGSKNPEVESLSKIKMERDALLLLKLEMNINEPNPLQFGQTRRVLLSYSKHLRMSLFTNSYMGHVEFHLHEPMIFGSPPTILTHIFSGAMTPASCEEEAWGTGALARSHGKICIGLHIVSHTLW